MDIAHDYDLKVFNYDELKKIKQCNESKNNFKPGKQIDKNILLYHIAQYLIKDLKPLETIEGEGFGVSF